MNKRIRQLAIEAKLIASEPNGFDQNNLSKAQQKFAELIIQKCCAIADEAERADVPVVASKFIKAHFGVEE